MTHVSVVVAVVVLMGMPCWSMIWQRQAWQTRRRNYLDRYQYVPPMHETAKKLTKNFLDRDPRKIYKRSVGDGLFYDVVFLLDSSMSVGIKEFKRSILSLQTLITRAKMDTTYAGILFSTTANITFTFTDPLTAMKNIGKTVYDPGMTNTQAALELCRTGMFLRRGNGMRRLSFKRILILTDGQSNVEKHKTLYNAFRLKNMGVEIFVVAVGKYLRGIAEIVGLASSTDAHLYRTKDMKGFLEIVRLIPPWHLIRDQQRTWLENMFEDTDDDSKYLAKRRLRK